MTLKHPVYTKVPRKHFLKQENDTNLALAVVNMSVFHLKYCPDNLTL